MDSLDSKLARCEIYWLERRVLVYIYIYTKNYNLLIYSFNYIDLQNSGNWLEGSFERIYP
jgi:hypothetical protein